MTLEEMAKRFPAVAQYQSLWVKSDYREYGQSLWEAKAKLAHETLLEVGTALDSDNPPS